MCELNHDHRHRRLQLSSNECSLECWGAYNVVIFSISLDVRLSIIQILHEYKTSIAQVYQMYHAKCGNQFMHNIRFYTPPFRTLFPCG